MVSTPVVHIGRKGKQLLRCKVDRKPSASLVEFTDFLELHKRNPCATIALIRDGHLGDLIALTGAINVLKMWFSDFIVDVYSDKKFVGCLDRFDCVSSHRGIEEIGMHDLLVDLQGFVECSVEKYLIPRNIVFGRALGLTDKCYIPPIEFTRREKKHVVIAPGASCKERAIPSEIVAGIVCWLNENGIESFVTDESNTKLGDLPDIIGNALFVICADNGISHLSQACRTNALVLFGPVDKQLRVSEYDCVDGLQSQLACSPCGEQCKVGDVGCNKDCMSYFDIDGICSYIEYAVLRRRSA